MCIKLLFDQNLSYRLVSRLKDFYPDSAHVASLNLDTASDDKIWKYAKDNAYTIVSKDSDFNDISILYNFPPHIIWLRLGNSRISEVEKVLLTYKETITRIIEEQKIGIIEINISNTSTERIK